MGVPNAGFVGRMQTGTASWIEPFNDQQLDAWTQKALANSPYRDARLDDPNPLPPIQHILYVVRENRTYDQVLGDLKEGNSDPSLVLFGENITPNLHKLAREFVLLDNFYVNSDVSADGHNWSTAAISPDYVEKLWPNKYANRRPTCDFAEQDPASLPPAGYLWTNAGAAGISMRNYGYMVNNKAGAAIGEEQITGVRDPVLAKVTNRFFRGFDLGSSRCRTRQGLPERPRRIRKDRQHAALDGDAARQRPYLRHHRRAVSRRSPRQPITTSLSA